MASYKPSKLVKQKTKTKSNEKLKPCSAPKKSKTKKSKNKISTNCGAFTKYNFCIHGILILKRKTMFEAKTENFS